MLDTGVPFNEQHKGSSKRPAFRVACKSTSKKGSLTEASYTQLVAPWPPAVAFNFHASHNSKCSM